MLADRSLREGGGQLGRKGRGREQGGMEREGRREGRRAREGEWRTGQTDLQKQGDSVPRRGG